MCDRLSGCTSPKESAAKLAGQESRATLRVAAAANLKFAFEEIEKAFESSHPDIEMETTYGSSGNFVAQISQSAPFDIFLSADTKSPAKLVASGHATHDDVFPYAVGRLVVWVPSRSSLDLETLGLQALADPAVKKIAIANPKLAPYGEAAETALLKANVYDAVRGRIVLGDNLNQAAQFVESGAADAGILSLSVAVSSALKGKGRYWEIPGDLHSPIEQAGVVLSRAKNGQAANELRRFLTGSEGERILSEFGYHRPGR